MSDDHDRLKERVRTAIDAINGGDKDALRELVADEVVVHGQGGQETHGAQTVVAATVDNEAFPDAHLEIEEMIAEEDTVSVRMTFTGTHEGDMHGVPPTGEEVEILVMAMYRIEDGQLAEGWFAEDDADTLQQLGLWRELTA
jgi:steroid delta-isomerase-like uncharacterized protein